MDKETLSNYGWLVICVIVLAIMILAATPFADSIKAAVTAAVDGLKGVASESLTSIA